MECPVKLIDVHCHLESECYTSCLDEVLHYAQMAGIVKLITASVHPDQWAYSATLARQYAIVEFAAGIHPWYCSEQACAKLDLLVQAASGAVAIGEIGLDSKTQVFSFARQLEAFIPQLKVAQQFNLPVILHCRGAFNELLHVFKKQGPPPRGILHNFSGSVEIADQFIHYGLAFSFGGALTWRNSTKRQKLLRHIYPDFFLLETDAPDIPPIEAKHSTHTPANILYNLMAAAEILERPVEEIAHVSFRNAVNLFNLNI